MAANGHVVARASRPPREPSKQIPSDPSNRRVVCSPVVIERWLRCYRFAIMADEDKRPTVDEEEEVEELDEEQAAVMREAKGKGKVTEEEDEEEDDEEEDFGEEEDDDDEDEDEDEDEEEGEDEEAPAAKKQKTGAGSSAGKPASRKAAKGEEDEDEDEAEVLANLSGDEVDPGLIIAGGRRARRGRPQPGGSASRPKYSAKAQLDSDEDDW